jgi:acetoin utilization deacetylase AcuC-like enzyme
VSDVGLILDPRFEQHDTGPGHPERPERAARVRSALEDSGLAGRCRRVEPAAAADEVLARVHDSAYIARVVEVCARGDRVIDSMDTTLCPISADVARLAAGSVVALAESVVGGELQRGLAVIRPPGHHAERDLAMGFCLFNNVAVAARALQQHEGIDRILIVDWDVHHGNGTQHIFEDDETVFYFSCHQFPLYPGTGAASERGRGEGVGTTMNQTLDPGSGDAEFLSALGGPLVEAAASFEPDFVLISAGFDAHRSDPLAQLEVTTEAFAEATRIVRGIADEHAGGRVVSLLEGGYDLDALSASVGTHLTEMLKDC